MCVCVSEEHVLWSIIWKFGVIKPNSSKVFLNVHHLKTIHLIHFSQLDNPKHGAPFFFPGAFNCTFNAIKCTYLQMPSHNTQFAHHFYLICLSWAHQPQILPPLTMPFNTLHRVIQQHFKMPSILYLSTFKWRHNYSTTHTLHHFAHCATEIYHCDAKTSVKLPSKW